MFNNALSFYFDVKPHQFTPLKMLVLTPGDEHLYLFTYQNKWYVLVEADFPLLKSLVEEIEAQFPVTVAGWQTLKEKTDTVSVIPRDAFSSDTANETDENWKNFSLLFHEEYGMKYALLCVVPNAGIGVSDFLGEEQN